MLWKCCNRYASKSGNLSSGHRTGKGQFSFQSQRKAMPKNVQTTYQLYSSHACKVMLKILQASLEQYLNCELPDVQAGFRKDRNQRSTCQHLLDHQKKQESSKKTSTFALLTIPNPLTVCITTTCGKFLKRWEYQIIWPTSWEICMQVTKQQLELDMEKQTGSK